MAEAVPASCLITALTSLLVSPAHAQDVTVGDKILLTYQGQVRRCCLVFILFLLPKMLPVVLRTRCCCWCCSLASRLDLDSLLCPQDLAVFTVESKWRPNKPLEAKNCYGTTSIEHPAVQVQPAAWLLQ